MTIAFDAEGNSPILPLEKREYVGNLKEFRINSNKSHVRVIGNHNKVIINTNRGHLEIVGNNTKVKIMYNCGEISYIGNNGTLLIGKESTNTNVSYIGSNGILKVLSNNKLNNIPRKNDDNIVTEKSSRAEKSEIIDNNKKKSFIQMMKSPFQKNDQHKCESNSFIFNENCRISSAENKIFKNCDNKKEACLYINNNISLPNLNELKNCTNISSSINISNSTNNIVVSNLITFH